MTDDYEKLGGYEKVLAAGDDLAAQLLLGVHDVVSGNDLIEACCEHTKASFGFRKDLEVDPFSLIVGAVWHEAARRMLEKCEKGDPFS